MKRLFALVLVFAFLLTACGGGGTSGSTGGSTPATDGGGTSTPADGGTSTSSGGDSGSGGGALKDTLVVAQGGDITSLDPLYARNTLSVTANHHLYDYLVFLTDDGEVQPMLAESWEETELKIVFKLRKDVKFHNGDPMTADDVVYSLTRVRDLNQVTWAAGFISDINKIDDYTVEVNFLEPYSGKLSQFTRPGANVVPQSVVEANPEAFATNPVGTGPYKFVEWTSGDHLLMERNDDYWGEKGKSKFINIRIIGETAQRLIALENGEIDIAYDVAANDISKIEGNSNLQMITGPSARCVFISTNTQLTDSPISDKKVLQAMQYAIDKETIVQAVSYGKGLVAHTMVPPSVFGASDKIKTEYNLERAKELMAEAGYADGFTVQLHTYSDQLYTEVAQVLQSQLAEIGITLDLYITDQATMIEMTSNNDHQLILKFWLTIADAHNTLYPYYHSTSSAAAGNSAFFKNEEYDRYVTEGKTASDPAARMAAYDKCYEIAAEELPYIPIFYANLLIGTSAKVEGFSVNPYGYHRLDTVAVGA